ncbi:MAG TPA: MauE/DoxX family redox-associated membrane protein, partial [Capillimicrobium sp.]
MHLILLVARAALAAVFLVAGLAKLADRDGSRAAMRGFGAPERAVAPLGLALPVAELLIGAALVPAASAPWAALAALALLTVFVAAIARAMRRGEAPDCHCFGQLHSAPAGRSTLIRNGALAAIAALVAVAGLAGASPSPTAWLGDLSDAALVAIGAGLALALAFGLFGWFGLELLRQNGRLLERIDGLEAALRGGADPAPAAPLEAPDVEVVTLD